MQLSEKPKTFCDFFIEFLESAMNFENCQAKLNLTASAFLKLLTRKNVFTETHKRSCFWKLIDRQLGRIYRYQFKYNYLKNQRHFAAFLLHF